MHTVVCLSRNGNYKGFDLAGLTFFFLEYKRVAFFIILTLYPVSFSWWLVFVWVKYLRIERHLAAKFGTFFALFFLKGRLYYGWMTS